MNPIITCPYCFSTFNQDDVLFRAETCFTEDDIQDDYDIDIMPDGLEKEEAREENDLKKAFLARVHPSYSEFWNKYNGTTEQTRKTNVGRHTLFFENYQKPVISPKNPRHVIFDNADGSGVQLDRDGFLSSVTDRFGKHTSNRVCPYCCNPLPMNYGKFPVKFISVIGITGAGKTVYLSSLLDNMHIYADKIGMTSLPNDAVNFFIELNKIGKDITLPQGTSSERMSQPLCYNLQYYHSQTLQRETSTFVIYDIAGENCVSKEGIQNFGPFISHSDGIIILQDPKQFSTIFHEANEMVKSVLENIITLFSAKHYCEIPVALCISKSDRLIADNLFEPTLSNLLSSDVRSAVDFRGFCASEYNEISKLLDKFYRQQDNPTRNALKNNFDKYNYFAVSSLNCELRETEEKNNATGESMLMPVESPHPLRIEEPLFWLFYQFGFIKSDEKVVEPGIAGTVDRLNREKKALIQQQEEISQARFMIGKRAKLNFIATQIEAINKKLAECINS